MTTPRRWQPSATARSHAGRPAGWKRTRAAVLARDGEVCRNCGQPGNTVDHITTYANGGTDDPDNLQVLCRSCHDRKTASEAGKIAAARRPRRKREPEPHPGLITPERPRPDQRA